MKQAKQVFYCGERNPLRQERKREREKLGECVCLRDNEREQSRVGACVYMCVCEVGWRGVCVDFSCKSQGCSGLTLPLSP